MKRWLQAFRPWATHLLVFGLGIAVAAFALDRLVDYRLEQALRTLPRVAPARFERPVPEARSRVPITGGVPGENVRQFERSARAALPTVVHITARPRGLRQYLGAPTVSTGSGVIASADGYIITNYHVVEGAGEITITTLDKNEFEARVIGTDPSTDLALLKVAATNLPAADFANSDSVFVGQWVLAIGNPFSLTGTVTAGIVSARSRNLANNRSNEQEARNTLAVESYIQTDAAVNPGNSGGALVDLDGHLVGINTAIATDNNTFQGYSFAIPSNLVNKVTRDLIEFGAVQRGFLGVRIADINFTAARRFQLGTRQGALILGVTPNGAAREAGLDAGDVVTAINKVPVASSSELQEQLANYRPGDAVELSFLRNQQPLRQKLVLRNSEGTTGQVMAPPQPLDPDDLQDLSTEDPDRIGIAFGELSTDELAFLKRQLPGTSTGIRVDRVVRGSLFAIAGMEEGIVLTHANNQTLRSSDDFFIALAHSGGQLRVQAMRPDGRITYYLLEFEEGE